MTNETTASQPKSIGDDALNAAMADQDQVPYLIVFDDNERPNELVIGADRAAYRFKQISISWNAHLFAKVKSNSPYDKRFNDNFRAPAVQASATIQAQKATLGEVWAAGVVHWDLFPGYLIDHCEGDPLTEEGLQFALHDMLTDADYLRISAERAATIQEPVMVVEPVAQAHTSAAADYIDAKAETYLEENAGIEPDTGATVFHYGEAGRDYHSSLVELAEEIRGIGPSGGSTCTVPPSGWHCTRAPGHEGACAAWPDAAPMVADPAGVAVSDSSMDMVGRRLRQILDPAPGTLSAQWHAADALYYLTGDEAFATRADSLTLAATVKAVPIEALGRQAGVADNLPPCDRPNECRFVETHAHTRTLAYYPAIYNALGRNINPDRNISSGGMKCQVCGKVAPLADKTGGGE
jgi:hypothetical protein